MEYFISYNGRNIGPMSKEQVAAYPLGEDTPVCDSVSQTWKPLYNYPELMEARQRASRGAAAAETGVSNKDRVVCGVLAMLLGSFGAQYFYLNKIGGALICIALTLVTCGAWSIISFVQGILMLTMTPMQFEEKYVYSQSTFPIF